MEWTDARVKRLKTLWKDGLSASEIAQRMRTDVSRNAIIGKARRLGLKPRQSPIKKQTATNDFPDEPQVESQDKLVRSGRACQWPIGNPGTAEFCWCDGQAEPNQPYCAKHCLIAYRYRNDG